MVSVQCMNGMVYASEEGSWKGNLPTLSGKDVIDAKQMEILPLTAIMMNVIFRCIWNAKQSEVLRG